MVSVCRPVCVSRQTITWGMCLVQDGWTSHIAHTTLSLLQLIPWSSKSPDHNPIKRNWHAIGRVFSRRVVANVRQFTCTAISNVRMERNYTALVECLGYMYVTWMRRRCQTVIEANGGHSRYYVQLICVVIIEFGNFIHVLT